MAIGRVHTWSIIDMACLRRGLVMRSLSWSASLSSEVITPAQKQDNWVACWSHATYTRMTSRFTIDSEQSATFPGRAIATALLNYVFLHLYIVQSQVLWCYPRKHSGRSLDSRAKSKLLAPGKATEKESPGCPWHGHLKGCPLLYLEQTSCHWLFAVSNAERIDLHSPSCMLHFDGKSKVNLYHAQQWLNIKTETFLLD